MGGDEDKSTSLTRIIIELTEREKPQNVQQLITLVKHKASNPEPEIMEHILRLQNQGKISLRELPTQIPHRFGTYLKTKESYWYWAILVLAVSATVAALEISENVYPIVYVRYVLGIIFIIYLPGYSFTKALFPKEPPIKTSSKSLDSIERIALSLGMSIALVPIVGLILNYTPWGIRLLPLVLSLSALTIISATAGILREYQSRPKQERSIKVNIQAR